MRWLSLVFLFLLIIATLAGAHLVSTYQKQVFQPLGLERDEILVVRPGQGFRQINRELVDRGWVAHPWMLEAHARYQGIAGRLQAGEYEVPADITLAKLLDNMARGVVVRHRLTAPEGWTARQFPGGGPGASGPATHARARGSRDGDGGAGQARYAS
jgi:UPF0755 protein